MPQRGSVGLLQPLAVGPAKREGREGEPVNAHEELAPHVRRQRDDALPGVPATLQPAEGHSQHRSKAGAEAMHVPQLAHQALHLLERHPVRHQDAHDALRQQEPLLGRDAHRVLAGRDHGALHLDVFACVDALLGVHDDAVTPPGLFHAPEPAGPTSLAPVSELLDGPHVVSN
eukprot:1573554-Lingulodinium_polyedra.AAC.1